MSLMQTMMEYFYTAYTKHIHDTKYYFVKRLMTFPEIVGAADIQEGFGMHTDFYKACNIAGITNALIQEKLWNQVNPVQMARIIPLSVQAVKVERKMSWPTMHWRMPLPRLKFKF